MKLGWLLAIVGLAIAAQWAPVAWQYGEWTSLQKSLARPAPPVHAAEGSPLCHAYCDVITRGALSRPEGPLPHDCRFFAECGCAYQCEGVRR